MSSLEETRDGMFFDLAASDHHRDVSEIQSYFRGKTVFVTGVTGFLGKLIVEKLLRTCGDVRRIYILVREKKSKGPKERVEELLDVPAFEPLKRQTPDFIDKLAICVGDCLEPNLGLSQGDIDLLKTEVNCILHCAATVRFDESLRKATYVNVRAVRDLLNMAKGMTQLTSFIYVSTAYSHCPRDDIDEKVYEPPIKGQQLMTLVESLGDDMLDSITPTVLKEWPNTYMFTKAVAEEIVKTEGKNLPVSIFKPSMVVASSKEPIPGWVDNLYGPSGFMIATGIGLLRVFRCDGNKRTDLVPADYVVNGILAAAWNVGRRTAPVATDDQPDPIVYNYTSGRHHRLSWGKSKALLHCNIKGKEKFYPDSFTALTKKYATRVPPSATIWHQMLYFFSNWYLYLLCEFLLHTAPAYIVDFFLLCVGRKPLLVDGYRKIRKFTNITSYFATHQWNFEDANVHNLWKKLNARDKELFEFDIKRLDWEAFIKTYVLGCRLYLLKDPIDTLPLAKRKARVFKVAHYTLMAVLFFLLYTLLKFLFTIFF